MLFISNIDKVLSINPSANVFVFGDFNVYHNDRLIYSDLIYWSIQVSLDQVNSDIIFLSQITFLKWVTFL